MNAAAMLVRGGDLYGDPAQLPFYAFNYPPGYALALAPLIALLGPSLWVGRLLSLLAGLGTAWVIYYAVNLPHRHALAAAAAALAFLASGYVYHVTPLARVTSFMLFLGVAGLYCLERGAEARTRQWVWLGVGLALLVAGVYTKPVGLDALAAGLVYLAVRRPRGWAFMGAGFGGLAVALHLGLDALSAGRYSSAVIVSNVYPMDWAQAMAHARNFLETHGLLLLVGVIGLGRQGRQPGGGSLASSSPPAPGPAWPLSVWVFYFAAGLVTAASSARWGAGESYFLPLIVASCVLGGRWLGWAAVSRRPAQTVALAALAVYPLLAGAGPWPLSRLAPGWDRGFQAWSLGSEPTSADLSSGQRIARFLAEGEGPVLSEGAGFVLANGGVILGNPLLLRGLASHSLYDPSGLVRALQTRSISRVVLHGQWYPQPILEAIGANYERVDEVRMRPGVYGLFRPKESGNPGGRS